MKKTNTLGELKKVLKDHKNTLSEKFGVIDIAIFGSYVRNEQVKRSDIDIFVDLKQKYKTFDNFMELKFFLEKITSKKVDLVIKESIRKELKPRVLKEAVHV